MKSSKPIIAAALLCGAIAMPATIASAQQQSLKDQLVGAWMLVSWEQTRPDGSKFHSFGTDPRGIQIFSADGRLFVMYARADLPKIAASDRNKATPQEAQAILGGSIAYHGTYTVDEASKTIVRRIDASTFPNQVGQELKWVVNALTADELKYTNPAPMSGGQIQSSLRRVTPATIGGPAGR
jgi:Lipocalin-like domain